MPKSLFGMLRNMLKEYIFFDNFRKHMKELPTNDNLADFAQPQVCIVTWM